METKNVKKVSKVFFVSKDQGYLIAYLREVSRPIQIFTDGAAKGNPGPGGYGAIMRYGKHERELSAGFRLTTNNRMELLAVIVALEAIKDKTLPVEVYSDSKYVVDAVEKRWVYGWVQKQFKGKKNKDLWLRYLKAAQGLTIKFHWIKGHNGHPENERCDFLAVQAAESKILLVDTVFEQEKEQGEMP